MGSFDDHVATMGDWMPPSPSPRSFFTSMLNDSIENRSGPLFPMPERQGNVSNNANYQTDGTRENSLIEGDNKGSSNLNPLPEPKISSSGLMERRGGFNAPRLNTESNSEVRSPFFMVPPGLSPTTLLDSPVFLTNSLAQPSPTTGKFSFALGGNGATLIADHSNKGKENTSKDANASSFAFKPAAESSSFPYFNAVNKANLPGFAQQAYPSIGASFHSITSIQQNNSGMFQQANFSEPHSDVNRTSNQTYNPVSISEHSPSLDEPLEDGGDQTSSVDSNAGNGPAEDGYNWRKYGQKQVKGSEFPRSYYKCTSPNCPVKKKVERSLEGHVTEIIYKGAHNHPKPPPSRRSGIGGPINTIGDMQPDGGLPWSNVQKDNLEGQEYESAVEIVDGSLNFSNDDDEEDRATHGSVSQGYDGEGGDELESKRRKTEPYASEISGNTRAIREPRVVVQTTSEVDILDDGYRWRKYGQKVVKGNPNPRSYYKCTSPGCNVRKHVERACHDLKSVITTYEGKHNHDVPAARNSNSHLQAPHLSSTTLLHRPMSSQMQHNGMPQFERPPMGSFGQPGRPQMGPGPGFGFGMGQQGLASLGMARFRPPNQGNPYLGQQVRPMMNMVPKEEPRLEMDPGLSGSNGDSVYQQLMGQMPLGPQM